MSVSPAPCCSAQRNSTSISVLSIPASIGAVASWRAVADRWPILRPGQCLIAPHASTDAYSVVTYHKARLVAAELP